MDQAICSRASTTDFWDGYARWYRLWMEHTRYHDRIVDVLMAKAEPGWKVLDIGAGNGVLSVPLCTIGCAVTALEPSVGMRHLLSEETFKRGIDWLSIDERAWEQVPMREYRNLDLVIACNTLHLTEMGLGRALDRAFKFNPKRLILATELYPGLEISSYRSDYPLRFYMSFETESSFAYHHLGQAIEHWTYKKGGRLSEGEIRDITKSLVLREDHYWMPDRATVGVFWWERNDAL